MSWTELTRTDPFGVHNLPWCAFTADGRDALGVRVGDRILDASAAERVGLIEAGGTMAAGVLNPFLARGRSAWAQVRQRLTTLLTSEAHRSEVEDLLHNIDAVRLRLPIDVGDYVDFYSSEHHAANVGRILRPGQPPVLENWRHLPIGYHGRAGTVVVSGTPIRRPAGQLPTPEGPVFGPTARLDIEAELGFIVGTPSALGEPVATADFREHVFGAVVVNDWSARDIQAYEYQPLGPHLAKSFATTISPWVVTIDALRPFLVEPPAQDPLPDPYLRAERPWGLDLELRVDLNGTEIAATNFAEMYWTFAQQLAHLTVNGAPVGAGDLFGSGTVSGPGARERGSLVELTWGGTHPLTLANGTSRRFLEDGDTVTLTGWCGGHGRPRIGFGAAVGTVAPPPSRGGRR